MPQLNVHIPATSDLIERTENYAKELGTSASSLARAVLEVALEPYVQAQRDASARQRERSAELVESLRTRFSGPLPARPYPEDDLLAGPPQEQPEPVAAGASPKRE